MTEVPLEWKAMDDFAAGIDGNRLPRTAALAGTELTVASAGEPELTLAFRDDETVAWRRADGRDGVDWYEAVEVRPSVYYLTITDGTEPLRADVLVLNRETGRTLTVTSTIGPDPTPGRPRVSQTFTPGTLADGAKPADPAEPAKPVKAAAPVEPAAPTAPTAPTAPPPAPSRDLIGLRALYRYSPNHLYEHVYLSSERYAWQCIVGEQRGHGDVDLATTWGLGDDLYVFTFREFLIPVAATWLYDLAAMRTTGTFVGLGADGSVRVAPGGAFITLLGRVAYPDEQPV